LKKCDIPKGRRATSTILPNDLLIKVDTFQIPTKIHSSSRLLALMYEADMCVIEHDRGYIVKITSLRKDRIT
jgi:hypothetical protein